MKSTIIKLVLVALFLNTTIEASTLSKSEVEAQKAVSSFFKYLKNNNTKKIKSSIPLDSYQVHEKLNNWDKWIKIWQSYSLVEVGNVENMKFVRKGRDKTVKVHIILKVDGKNSKGTINVSLIKGHWVWDEN